MTIETPDILDPDAAQAYLDVGRLRGAVEQSGQLSAGELLGVERRPDHGDN